MSTAYTGGDGSNAAPAGWYPDGEDPQHERYWDGRDWTEHERTAGVPVPRLGPDPWTTGDIGGQVGYDQYRRVTPAVAPGRTAGFLCGLLGLLLCAVPIVGAPLSIVGIVQSSRAMKRIPVGSAGRGLATAGFWLGWAGVAGSVLWVFIGIAVASAQS